MPINTKDDLITALANATPRDFAKASFSPQAVGAFFELWNTGGSPVAGGNPGSGVNGDIPTDDTAGAFDFDNPAAGVLNYLTSLEVMASQPGMLILFDRLWQNSALSVTSTSLQAIAPPALTRPDALGKTVEAWLTVTSAL